MSEIMNQKERKALAEQDRLSKVIIKIVSYSLK